MQHTLCLLLLVLVPAVAAQSVSGTLGTGDETRDNDAFYDSYTLDVAANQFVTVRMESDEFDTYLVVKGPNDFEQFNDDFEGSTSVSQLEFLAPAAGTYTIWATSYAAETEGAYTLIQTLGGVAQVETIQGRLDRQDPQALKGEYYDTLEIQAPRSGQFFIELESLGFDGYIRVTSPTGEIWRNDDAGTGDYSLSRVGPFEAAGGTWKVDVTTVSEAEVGAYDLRIVRIPSR